ncbi:MAG TPA: C40 family peptidase [Flavobacteriaceae bacterium]|nr:C40 family peptidase [Flavobacteriaceae bacterium]
MKKLPLVFLLTFLFVSCGTSKKGFTIDNSKKESSSGMVASETAVKIVETALEYEGTPYKYGGTTKRGMDCSGLVYVAFQEENISLPRRSRDMSLQGRRLKLKEVLPGDLLFFQTNKNRKVINHVGIVVETNPAGINFIHSSTSRGVIISNLKEPYWNGAFVMARRVL